MRLRGEIAARGCATPDLEVRSRATRRAGPLRHAAASSAVGRTSALLPRRRRRPADDPPARLETQIPKRRKPRSAVSANPRPRPRESMPRSNLQRGRRGRNLSPAASRRAGTGPGRGPGQFLMLSRRASVGPAPLRSPAARVPWRSSAARLDPAAADGGRGPLQGDGPRDGAHLRGPRRASRHAGWGPLGRGFPAARPGERALLVGGGTGIASLYELAARLQRPEGPVRCCSAPAAADDLMGRADFEALGVETAGGHRRRQRCRPSGPGDRAPRVGADPLGGARRPRLRLRPDPHDAPRGGALPRPAKRPCRGLAREPHGLRLSASASAAPCPGTERASTWSAATAPSSKPDSCAWEGAAVTRRHALVSTSPGIELRNPLLTASGTFGYGLRVRPLPRPAKLHRRASSPRASPWSPARESAAADRRGARGHAQRHQPRERGVDAFVEEKLPEIPPGCR